jgi:hypothetical protein
MFRSILTTSAIVALAAGASAQNQLPAGNISHAVAPSTGIYKMDTGFEATPIAYRSGPETLFNNRDGVTYYFTYSLATDEYADGGAFPARGVTGEEQVNGLTFEYCSAMADPNGTGVLDTELRFYEANDQANFAGIVGWVDASNRNEACILGLTGLPGDQQGTGIGCWILGLDLAGGFECTLPQESAPGTLEAWGWSMTYLDPAGTSGPLLDSIVGATNFGYGVSDQFQWYDMTQVAGAENLGAYWFGGAPKLNANFNLSLEGNANDSMAYSAANPLANDTLVWGADSEVRPGQAASWSVANTDGSTSYAMLVSSGQASIPVIAGGTATLLVSPNFIAGPFNMGTAGTQSANLPGNLPPAFYTQAAGFVGALGPANSTSASNGMKHSN